MWSLDGAGSLPHGCPRIPSWPAARTARLQARAGSGPRSAQDPLEPRTPRGAATQQCPPWEAALSTSSRRPSEQKHRGKV